MVIENYFTSSASNPIELAEINLQFYAEFIASMGCSSYNKHLWPGEDLASFIQKFTEYAYQTGNKEIICKALKLKAKYASYYYELTGCAYTNNVPKSTIPTS
jgi:hypothetical protein